MGKLTDKFDRRTKIFLLLFLLKQMSERFEERLFFRVSLDSHRSRREHPWGFPRSLCWPGTSGAGPSRLETSPFCDHQRRSRFVFQNFWSWSCKDGSKASSSSISSDQESSSLPGCGLGSSMEDKSLWLHPDRGIVRGQGVPSLRQHCRTVRQTVAWTLQLVLRSPQKLRAGCQPSLHGSNSWTVFR